MHTHEAKTSQIQVLPSHAGDVIRKHHRPGSGMAILSYRPYALLPNREQSSAVNHDVLSDFYGVKQLGKIDHEYELQHTPMQ